jgi:hypothetical protein
MGHRLTSWLQKVDMTAPSRYLRSYPADESDGPAEEARCNAPEIGDFVEVRGCPWQVEGIDDKGGGLSALQLSCISDDAQGEALEVAWDADIGARRLEDDFWSRLGRDGTLQAPFRAGIRLEAYQLLPLRKALRLPRVQPLDRRRCLPR